MITPMIIILLPTLFDFDEIRDVIPGQNEIFERTFVKNNNVRSLNSFLGSIRFYNSSSHRVQVSISLNESSLGSTYFNGTSGNFQYDGHNSVGINDNLSYNNVVINLTFES